MSKQDDTSLEHAAWRNANWNGPTVEPRPDVPTPEWPADAAERVTFDPELCVDLALLTGATAGLSFSEYFGADGWPLTMPEVVKHRLTPSQRLRLLVAFHARPWTATLAGQPPEVWMSVAKKADALLRTERLTWQVKVLETLQPVLPEAN